MQETRATEHGVVQALFSCKWRRYALRIPKSCCMQRNPLVGHGPFVKILHGPYLSLGRKAALLLLART